MNTMSLAVIMMRIMARLCADYEFLNTVVAKVFLIESCAHYCFGLSMFSVDGRSEPGDIVWSVADPAERRFNGGDGPRHVRPVSHCRKHHSSCTWISGFLVTLLLGIPL